MPRILVAEGHPATREFVARSLADAGLEAVAPEDPQQVFELYAAQRADAVVLAADLAAGPAGPLAQQLRAADPRALLVIADKEHLGKARGLAAVLPLKPNAYVADPTRRELVDKVQQLVAQAAAAARARLRGAALVLSRAPAARGEVRPGVVARLLHQIWRSAAEGVLVLEQPAGPAQRIFFQRGAPVALQSDDPADALLRWLREAGRIDAAAQRAAVEGMASGLSPGAALVAAGVLEPGEPLSAALRAHLEALVARAVGAREGRWRFHAGGEFAGEVHATPVLPLRAILEGARGGIPARHFSEALRAVTDAYPVRTGDFQQVLPAAGLSSGDLRLAVSIDGRTRMRDWLEARRTELRDALTLLWFLSMVGAVAFHEAPEAGDAVYGKAPAPPRRRPLPADRAEAVRQAALQILPGSYFRALGVDISAGPAEIEAAYREVAGRFHPDAFAQFEVGDLEDLLAAVQDKVTAAYKVLSTPEKREAYLSFLMLRYELSGVRRPGIDVAAEIALKRGERALRARRISDALAAFREAVERNPREPEYLAMLGFAALHDPALPPGERAQEARRQARKALSLAPDGGRAAAVLALAEAALGEVAEARRVTLAALKAQPDRELLKQVLHRLNAA
ncbi:DnaJ domain-containing protein [Anaeromyxobacter sp. Red801]|uniref:DnaJ domain-containing protein n=1 Tax=Anaeromyxobacter sp. Red801 TaxID=3411632 RepID=UPI003BA1CF57